MRDEELKNVSLRSDDPHEVMEELHGGEWVVGSKWRLFFMEDP